jgi:hypothetical protein
MAQFWDGIAHWWDRMAHLWVVTCWKEVTVTDKGTKMCVDPGGNGAILNARGGGGPGPPGGEENGQLASDSGGG